MIININYNIQKRIVLKRVPYTSTYIIILENGDSYETSIDDMRLILKKFELKDVESILDYVHNFYCAIIHIRENQIEPITMEQTHIFEMIGQQTNITEIAL